jgi:hypothetical protein
MVTPQQPTPLMTTKKALGLNPSTAYASINPFVGVSQNDMAFVTSTTSGVYNNASTVFTDGTIISGTVTYFV